MARERYYKDSRFYVHQADVTLNQANPVSGTIYNVLPKTSYVRIISVEIEVTWTVQPTPLESRFTLDGQNRVHTFTNPVSATPYYPEVDTSVANNAQPLTATNPVGRAFLYESKLCQVRAETTGGTTSNLTSRCCYARYI